MSGASKPHHQNHQRRVLVVDDEKNIRLTLGEALKQLGLDVDTAVNGEQALSQLEEEDYRLLLLDINMPGIDGMAVLRWVREHRPFTKVIMITAHGTPFDAVEAVQIGAADFLQKPFSVEEVQRHVTRVLSRDTEDPLTGDYDEFIERGRSLINDRQFEAAEDYIYDALRRGEARPETYDLLGVLYQLHGDVEKARRCFEKALALDISYAPARRNLRQLMVPPSRNEERERRSSSESESEHM